MGSLSNRWCHQMLKLKSSPLKHANQPHSVNYVLEVCEVISYILNAYQTWSTLCPPPKKNPFSRSVSIIFIFVHYKFELFRYLQPHLCSLSLFKLVQSRSCVAVFHWLGLFHINAWQRHLSRLFVISHKNARGQRFIGQNIINLQLSKIMDFSKG